MAQPTPPEHQRSLEEYRLLLGVRETATQAEIRSAYLDLVQVWHPDRFTGNARLAALAERKLRELNKAYEALSSATPLETDGATTAEAGARPACERPVSPNPFRLFESRRGLAARLTSWSPAMVWIWSLILPSVAMLVLFQAIRVISRDAETRLLDIPYNPLPRPASAIDVRDSLRLASDHVMSWALGQIGLTGTSAGQRPAITAPPPSTQKSAPRTVRARPIVASIAMQRDGSGRLAVRNNTSFDAIAFLVSLGNGTTRTARALGGQTATIDHIVVGSYVLEIRFDTGGPPQTIGRFDFLEVQSAAGSHGDSYDVIIRTADR